MQEDWYLNCSQMRQTEEECFLSGLSPMVAAVYWMRQREQIKNPDADLSAWQPTAQEVDDYMRECACDCPLAFLAYTWLRLKAVVYAMIDTKHDGDFGNHERYVQLLPAILTVLTVCNAHNYCPMLVVEIERWVLASENEKTLFAHGIYAMISAQGASTVWFDEAQEKVNFGVRKAVGKDYWEGKEMHIVRAALNLSVFQQHRRKNAHGFTTVSKDTVTTAGPASVGSDRDSTLPLSEAFWGPLKLWRESGVWRAGAELVIKGQSTPRAALTTLGGLPLNTGLVGWLTVAQARHEEVASRVGLGNQWAHGVCVAWIAGTATAAADSSLSQWRRKYSTDSKEISQDWKVADLQQEIIMLKTEWHAFKGGDDKPVTAPTLPAEWHMDPQKAESFWAQPLTNWTLANINKTLKPRLCAMLAEARAVLMRSGAIQFEARPQVDASARLQIDAALLTKELAAHPLIRPLPSADALAERVRVRERKRGADDDTRGNSE